MNGLAATFLEGTPAASNQGTSFTALALDSQLNVFLGGTTASSDFPLRNPLIAEYEDGSTAMDTVLAEMTPDLSTLRFGSYLSSQTSPFAPTTFAGLALDPEGNLVAAGSTFASDFPTTPGSFQSQPPPPPPPPPYTTYAHSFVARLAMGVPAPSICADSWGLSFGEVTALTSSQQVLHLVNCGNAPLNLNSVTSSDPKVSLSQSCGTIVPGSSCAVAVTFTPADDAETLGTATLIGNMTISPQYAAFSGQGMAPDLEPNFNPFNMGRQPEGTQGIPQAIELYNRGNAPLDFAGISVSGPAFSMGQNDCTGNMPAEALCVVNLVFAPTGIGVFSGSLAVHSNDPVQPVLTVGLTGIGDSSSAGFPAATLSTTSLDFGAVVEGASNAPQNISLTNSGSAPLTIQSIRATGNYAETNSCGTSLNAGSTCQISVTFSPASVGAVLGNLTITDNAENSPQMVSLSGQGVAADIHWPGNRRFDISHGSKRESSHLLTRARRSNRGWRQCDAWLHWSPGVCHVLCESIFGTACQWGLQQLCRHSDDIRAGVRRPAS